MGIGVDFGTSSVKVVELRKAKTGVELLTYATAAQPNLLVDNRAPDAVARMAMLLRAMFQKAGVARGEVMAALPILSVFSTVLDLPDMSDAELDRAVNFAAKNYVPSPLNDVTLGWTRVGVPRDQGLPSQGALDAALPPRLPLATKARAGESPLPAPAAPAALAAGTGTPPAAAAAPPEGQAAAEPRAGTPATRKVQEVFLTAAPKESVTRYTAVFERLEIQIAALEVESFPLARALLKGEKRPALLVDFGDQTTSFSVVDEGYLRINQAMDVGGENLTKEIAEKLSLKPEDAEQKKRTEGVQGGEGTPIAAAIRPVLTEIVTRGETVRRLYERKRSRPLGKVVLIGGGARLPGLTSLWSQLTGLPAEVGNPWKGILVPPSLAGRLEALWPAFAVAVGLALRPFEGAA